MDPFVAAAWLPDRQEVREADREEDQEGRHACAAAAEVPGRSGPAGPVAAGRRPRRGRILTAALGLLLAADLALGVTAALLAFRHAHLDAVATARREALAAAVKEIVPVLTLDYTTLKADERKALAGLTPAYGRRYYRAVLAPFDKLASQEHAQVQSSVSAAAVISASPSTVQVLAFVDTQKLNKTTPGGTIFGERLRLTLVRSGDRWLISDIVAE